MPKFAYSAISATGAEIEGTTKADTIGTARQLLVEQNLYPVRIEEAKGMLSFELTKAGRKQLAAETNEWRRLAAAIGRILGPEEA